MKKSLSILLFFLVQIFFPQKYGTKNGTLHFDASIPLFENVDATNKQAVAIMKADNGAIAIIAMVKNFDFKVSLMGEHFQESYAESNTYPKTTFTGTIQDFKEDILTQSPKKFIISGDLTFHGVTKTIQSPAMIYKKGSQIFINGKLDLKTADFKVKIPKMVSKKVAETVSVDYNFMMNKQ